MKEITYIQFGSGWIPPTHRRLNIMNRIFIKTGISEKGAEYMIMRGHITDEDATLLKLLDQHAKIRDVKEEKNERRDTKKLVHSKNSKGHKSN